ncbi:MAG TPA: TetR/AcrR family transcriptional regulator [Acidimicrobiales bacterium]|nr:TetR/AcrR family transcriptional regulator [Acidimicrobiales bacterium]
MPTDVELDGRRLRREQNREAVLEALCTLHAEGRYEPGIAAIAERAGLSPRSVFRYFDDIDDLTRAAIHRQLAQAQPLVDLDVAADEPLAVRIRAVVEQRCRLFEATGPPARAARVCAHRLPLVADQVHQARTFLRQQLLRVFAPELAGAGAVLLPAVDALCSFETHELLRGNQGLSRPETVAALTEALTALLEAQT